MPALNMSAIGGKAVMARTLDNVPGIMTHTGHHACVSGSPWRCEPSLA